MSEDTRMRRGTFQVGRKMRKKEKYRAYVMEMRYDINSRETFRLDKEARSQCIHFPAITWKAAMKRF